MSKKIIIFIFVISAIYALSFYSVTDKYYVLFTTNQCGVARLVSYEWQRKLFYIAHGVEKFFLNQRGSRRSMHVETEELKNYFSNQLCNTSNGQEIGS